MNKAHSRFEVKANSSYKSLDHAKYILGVGKFEKKQEEIIATKSGNLPTWAKGDPLGFWKACDKYEKDKDGKEQLKYREHLITLPRELSHEQMIELVERWIEQEIGKKHAYSYAIHNPISNTDGKPQPHVHLMYSPRTHDSIERPKEQYYARYKPKNSHLGGCRKENEKGQRAKALQEQKDRFAKMANEYMRECGLNAFVDLSSREARGKQGKGVKTLTRGEYHALKTAEKARQKLQEEHGYEDQEQSDFAEAQRLADEQQRKAAEAAFEAFSDFFKDFEAEAMKKEQDFMRFGFWFKEKDEQEYHRNIHAFDWRRLGSQLSSELYGGNTLHAVSYKNQLFAVGGFEIQSDDNANQEFFDYCSRIVRGGLVQECRLISGAERAALLESERNSNNRIGRKMIEQEQAEARQRQEQQEREKAKDTAKDNDGGGFGFSR